METRQSRDRRPVSQDRSRIKATSGVILWRPDIVLAASTRRIERPSSSVVLAEPIHRPESVKARNEAAWSLLASLSEARETLSAQAAAIEARALLAESDRERVSLAFDHYRVEAALDDVLSTASTQVSALLKERGLR